MWKIYFKRASGCVYLLNYLFTYVLDISYQKHSVEPACIEIMNVTLMALVSPLVLIILVRRHKPNYVSLKQCFNKPFTKQNNVSIILVLSTEDGCKWFAWLWGAPWFYLRSTLWFQRGSLSKQAPCFECLYWNTYFGILSSTKLNTARGLWFFQQESSIQMSSLYCNQFQIPATTSSKATNIWTLKPSRNLYNFTPILWLNSENQESSQLHAIFLTPNLHVGLGLRGF